MSRPFIVIGDPTDHGGVVVGASGTTETHGKRIARVGDQVTCPKKGHGTTVIVSGDPTMIIDGMPAARHGDKCACGATLIASQVVSTTLDGGTSNSAAASQAQKAAAMAAGLSSPAIREEVTFEFDEQTKLVVDGDTATLVGVPWFIRTHDGRTLSGRLDDQGQLPRVITDSEQQYEAYWGDAAIVEMELAKA
jgi:uncharacterized Zn-binding protein involved in type VI secretion